MVHASGITWKLICLEDPFTVFSQLLDLCDKLKADACFSVHTEEVSSMISSVPTSTLKQLYRKLAVFLDFSANIDLHWL